MCHEAGGKKAAVLAALEDIKIRNSAITVDALHTLRNTADAIVCTHGARYLFAVKGDAFETFGTLTATNRERDAQRWLTVVPAKPFCGRRDSRSIECVSPLDTLFTIRHVRQMFRIAREQESAKPGIASIERDHLALPYTGIARSSPLPQPRTFGH